LSLGKQRKHNKSRNLTIYLVKSDYTKAEEIFENIHRLKKHEVKTEGKLIGELFICPSNPHLPTWTKLFEGSLDLNKLGSISSSTAAVLIMTVNKHVFALSFGFGKNLLKPGIWEERFGLLVTINSVDHIRSIDKRTFGSIPKHSREQASREVVPADFGIDIEQDILRAVTGPPSDTSLGARLTGIDALVANVKTDLNELPSLLSRYYEQFKQTTYKEKGFELIDYIAEVSNKLIITELDTSLVDLINSHKLNRIWMAVPEIVEWANVKGFRYGGAINEQYLDDISIGTFMEIVLKQRKLSIDILRSRKVHCLSNVSDTPFATWTVYQCIYAEIDRNNEVFMLNGGKWYKIDSKFANQLNKFIASIPVSGLRLPPYADKSEFHYNKRVCELYPKINALMDRKLIRLGARYSPIEFCDIYTRSKEIIHIKRYGGSSVLSHLFSQGVVSAELFHTEPSFRKKINDELPRLFKIRNPLSRPNTNDYKVIFGIISTEEGGLTLPFFSRITLRHAAKIIQAFGYQCAIVKIPVVPGPTQLKLLKET